MIEAPIVKKKNTLIASKFLPDKYSSLPPRRSVELSKYGEKRYIVFNTTSDPDRKDVKKVKHFLHFLFKVNYSNRIYVPLNLKDTTNIKKSKVFVEYGNNHALIKSLLSQRFWI